MSELSNREQELVALGAALASNCVPCIEYHVPAARKAGFNESQIREAVRIADKVRRVPARTVLRTAMARIGESRQPSLEPTGAVCGCAESTRGSNPGRVAAS